MRVTSLIFSGVFVSFLAGSTHAHHSFAAYYDPSKTVEITGVVVDFQFINPHSFIIVDAVQENGSVERWQVESNSANTLRTKGWDENTFNPGDVITVSGLPHRKSIPQMEGREFVKSDGTKPGEGRELGSQSLAETYPPDLNARGISGRWLGSYLYPESESAPGSRLPLTPAGLEAWGNYDSEHSPIVTCEPMNIPTLF